ncbi:hypothetical protein ABH931_005749 [Streptacidiphilus sp. MAP12-33]|uniref:acyl-CoA carboxylase epsilon subunit n=1 Tax=Streptacidiphilus sp. MAP12-33 TaxID=3156266 RepID=UPI003512B37F
MAVILTVHAGSPTDVELAAIVVALLATRRAGCPEGDHPERWAEWPGSEVHQPPDWSAQQPDTSRFGTW